MDRIKASIQRLDEYTDRQNAKIDITETVEERSHLIWTIVNRLPSHNRREARLAAAKEPVEKFLHMFHDPAPGELHERAYKRLRAAIGFCLGH